MATRERTEPHPAAPAPPPLAGSRLAVIDVGSNSFRLVVFATQDGAWRRTDEIYELVRIGEGVDRAGALAAGPMRRALAVLDVFAHFCRAAGLGHDQVVAVATSAVREAANRDEFLAAARERTGLELAVLSREEEARYGYLAAVNSTTLADGAVLDLGGGSMQVVRVDGRLERESGSWTLGAVRMTERFLGASGPAKAGKLEDLRRHARRELERSEWLAGAGDRLVGVGGTVRNLASAVDAAAEVHVGIQGLVVSRDRLGELIETLAGLPAAKRGTVAGIKPTRADIILAGAVVIDTVMEVGGFPGLEATEAGLREGVFFERLLAPASPPLFDDVRAASVLNLAAVHGVDSRHTAHVAALALPLFDDLAEAGLHAGDPIERELLWAACMLHDIGMAIDYDDHHKHSRYLVLNAGLPGFTPAEVGLIAQVVRYHRKGRPDPGPFAALLGEQGAARLARCAALLRLAEGLERSRDQSVRSARLRPVGDELELELDAAEGAVAVPAWAAAREGELFREAFGRPLRVSGAG